MCGISGWFSRRPLDGSLATRRIGQMNHALRHRGPDGEGSFVAAHAALGHTRLAIIDPSGGHQPVEHGDLVMVFNGEIYNFQELRGGLELRGERFCTRSDSEVLLRMYARYGSAAFSRLRGMYALAIWDKGRRTGVLVRDPVGIKPLFVAQCADELWFASESKAILAADGVSPEPDTDSLHLLLNLRYVPGTRTLFRGITQLAPGEILTWNAHGETRRSQIEPPAVDPDASIAGLFREAVRLQLTSDVEVACYLSGGIDSALVCAAACRESGVPLRSFTLNVGDDPQEAANARATAALLGSPNSCAAPENETQESFRRLIRHVEIPKVNAFQSDAIARHTARHVKVALSGLGGDELFLGYNIHGWMASLERLHRPSLIAPLRWAARATRGLLTRIDRTQWSEPERLLRVIEALGNWHCAYGLLRNVWDTPEMRSRVYGPRILDTCPPDAFAMLEGMWSADDDPVAAAARFEWNNKMVNDLLWNEDRCSMAHGLEVRVPFLDTQFSTAVRALPRQVLMHGGRPKAYMRTSLGALLPERILQRPKSGFQLDAPEYFHSTMLPWAREYLDRDCVQRHGIFNPDFVDGLMRMPRRRGSRWHYFMLILVAGTHCWMDEFLAPANRASGAL